MFWVSLVKITDKGNNPEEFDTNFLHIKDDIYIFEGDIHYVRNVDGVSLKVISEGLVPSLGGLSKKELLEICDSNLGVVL